MGVCDENTCYKYIYWFMYIKDTKAPNVQNNGENVHFSSFALQSLRCYLTTQKKTHQQKLLCNGFIGMYVFIYIGDYYIAIIHYILYLGKKPKYFA